MEYLFINSPSYQYTPSPVVGIPSLLGILENKGISAKFIDLNLDFINRLLKSDYILEYIKQLDNLYKINTEIEVSNKIKKLVESIQSEWDIYRKNLLMLKSKAKYIYTVFASDKFYDPVLFRSALIILRAGLISYYKSIDGQITNFLIDDLEDCRSNCVDPTFNIDVDFMLEYFKSEFTSLKKYYEEILPEIIPQDAKCIGISVGHYYQFVPAMMLCFCIKQKYNVHINIGGSFFNDYYKLINNLDELFSVFFDSISIDDNTKTVYELVEYINGEREITEIENIIYCQNNKIFINKSEKMNSITNLPFQEFNGYENINYIVPKERIFLPIRASYGCYWHKCIFCMCSNSNINFVVKPVKKFIDEIEYLSKKYKTKHFYFWDNSLPPQYLSKMADILIEKKLNIKYSIYARFEKEFDYELLRKLKKSGCLMIYWGLDAASERVLKYINKGITLDTAKRILKDSKKAKIANMVFVILGHPTETLEDIQKTYDFAKEVRPFVQDVSVVANCLFVEGSIIQKNREYYKNLILTTREQREEVCKKVKTLFNKFDGIHSVNYLLYLEKFGLFGCDLRFRLGYFLINNTNKYNVLKPILKLLYKMLYIIN